MTQVLLDYFVGANRHAEPDRTSTMQLRHALQRLNEAIDAVPADRRDQVAAGCARRLARHVDGLASDLLLTL